MLQSRLLPANHATTHAKRQSVVTRAADSNWPAGKHPLPPLLQGSAAVQPMPVSARKLQSHAHRCSQLPRQHVDCTAAPYGHSLAAELLPPPQPRARILCLVITGALRRQQG